MSDFDVSAKARQYFATIMAGVVRIVPPPELDGVRVPSAEWTSDCVQITVDLGLALQAELTGYANGYKRTP